jgi:hypothetical protein
MGGGDAVRCRRDGSVLAKSSVRVLVKQVVGLPRFHKWSVITKGLSGVVACSQRSRAAKKGDILIAGITFNQKASLETHGDVP